MVISVAVLPRVDQRTKVMPNFWRAVYLSHLQQPNWSAEYKVVLTSSLAQTWLSTPDSPVRGKDDTHTEMLTRWLNNALLTVEDPPETLLAHATVTKWK